MSLCPLCWSTFRQTGEYVRYPITGNAFGRCSRIGAKSAQATIHLHRSFSAAWYSSNLDKILRLRTHIEWAAGHGVLDTVGAALRALAENEWHHLDD
jgi:hypothetical protein